MAYDGLNDALYSTGIINGDWSLMTINRTSGAPTQVGVLGVTARGLAMSPTLSVPEPAPSIPEPGTLAIFGLGLAGLGVMRRRRAA